MNIIRHPLTKSALIACIITILFSNSHFYSYAPYGGYFLVPLCFLSFAIHFVFYFTIVWISANNRYFAWIILPLLLATQMFCFQSEVIYGVQSSALAVATLNASANEVLSYLNKKTLLPLLAGIIGIACICYIVRTVNPDKCRFKRWVTIGSLVACLVACSLAPISKHVRYHTKHKDSWVFFMKAYQPAFHFLNFWSGTWTYLTPDKLQSAGAFPSETTFTSLPDAVVLYIGEAIRADHSPLNGYHRDTTPGIRNCKNIINLPNVLSEATQTLPAIYSILTCTSPETKMPTHRSFVEILAKHSYKQHLIVGANTEGWWYLKPHIASLIDEHLKLYSRPASAQEYATDFISLLSQKSTPQFILIEDGAGHMPYKSEHTTYGQACDLDKYDNCILDVDARLSAIIRVLESHDAILLFTSDHGESFGEEGRFGHAGPMTAIEQRHVFSFIWYSDSYAEKHPEIINALKENAHRFRSHDYIYHTILSLSGVRSEIQIPVQDMTRQQ